MAVEKELENYLAALDKALGQISVSERSEIITEIKSHVLDARENYPNKSLSEILRSLGEPENVANRYLLERGLKPGKAPKSPMVKWLTIGFLGSFLIAALLITFVIVKFTPLLSVDEKNEKVTILGGLIQVDGQEGRVHIGNSIVQADLEGQTFEGVTQIDFSRIKKVKIPFERGKLTLSPSLDDRLTWKCRAGEGDQSVVDEEKSEITLNLSHAGEVWCEIGVPKGVAIDVRGKKGSIDLVKPNSETSISLKQGRVGILPDPRELYRFDTKVMQGKMDAFKSSASSKAIPIRVLVEKGVIYNREK